MLIEGPLKLKYSLTVWTITTNVSVEVVFTQIIKFSDGLNSLIWNDCHKKWQYLDKPYSRINLLNLGSCHIYYACVTFILKRCWNVPEHTHCYKIIFCIDSVLFSDLFLDWNTNILQMYARKCSEYLDEKTHKINIYKI